MKNLRISIILKLLLVITNLFQIITRNVFYVNSFSVIETFYHCIIPVPSHIFYKNPKGSFLLRIPSPLQIGDTIGLIAPCSGLTKERLAQSIEVIQSLGYHVQLGDSATQSLHGYLAGDDVTRANDINHMFANPNIDGIICLRGGYGSTRIMKLLNYRMIQHHPKLFVGYSDVTSFHLAFHSLCHMISFHGPMVSSNMVNDFDEYTRRSFQNAIQMPHCLTHCNPRNHSLSTLVPGCAQGQIIGGCLSLLSPAIGTFYQPNFRGKILFLEDVGETLPRCDKLMQHLSLAGVFDQINGILLGTFKDCINPNDETYTMDDYFIDFFQHYNKPVIQHVWSGHEKPMATIPFGTLCTIDTKNYSIRYVYR